MGLVTFTHRLEGIRQGVAKPVSFLQAHLCCIVLSGYRQQVSHGSAVTIPIMCLIDFLWVFDKYFLKKEERKERREVIRVRWGHEEQTNGILALIRRDIQEPLHPHLLFLSVLWGHSREKVAVCKLGKNLSPEPKHAGTPILKFQPLGLWEK